MLAADSEGRYSHTGILKKERGAWYVIHAVPGEPDFKGDADRIKMEPVERFFDAGKAARGAVMHVQADSALACRAARSALGLFRKHLLFDHDYDLNDTTEMYCTELIDYVYRKEGIDLSEGRTTSVNIPGMSGDYLMPNDIAQSGRLCFDILFLNTHYSLKQKRIEKVFYFTMMVMAVFVMAALLFFSKHSGRRVEKVQRVSAKRRL